MDDAAAQVDLRTEIKAWVAENAEGVGAPVDAADLTFEQFTRNREFHRALGRRGWYAPSWPAEYGGGGLPRETARIVARELAASIPNLHNVASPGDIIETAAQGVWAFGSEEQKRDLLPKMLRGEITVWELFTEPEAGSDLPSLKTRAVRDGDDYIVSGTKTFVGGHFSCDYFLCLAITDPEAPRQRNLSAILIPWGLPGVTVTDLDMIAGSKKRTIVLDEVRVPVASRICPEGTGWAVFTREKAPRPFGPVGLGPSTPNDLGALRDLLREWKKVRDGATGPEVTPALSRRATEIWVEGEVQRLLRARLRVMAIDRSPATYETVQVVLNLKEFQLRLGEAMQALLGPAAGVSSGPWSHSEGELEYFQRYAILATHPGGTIEVQKMRMFRGMEAKLGFSSRGR